MQNELAMYEQGLRDAMMGEPPMEGHGDAYDIGYADGLSD